MVLGAQFGEMLIPIIFKAVGVLQKFIGKWQDLGAETQGVIGKIVIGLGVGGPVLAGLSRMLIAVKDIIGKFSLWKLGLVAVVTAGFLIWKNWDVIKEKIDKATVAFSNYKNSHNLFNTAWEETRAKLLGGLEALKMVGNASANTVGAITNALNRLTRGNISGAWDAIVEGGDNTIHAWNQMIKNLEHIEGVKQLNLMLKGDAPKGKEYSKDLGGTSGKTHKNS